MIGLFLEKAVLVHPLQSHIFTKEMIILNSHFDPLSGMFKRWPPLRLKLHVHQHIIGKIVFFTETK